MERHTLDLLTSYRENFVALRSLKPAAFAAGLVKCPDKEFVNKIVTDVAQGVRIGYTGPRESRTCVNWPSVQQFEPQVRASIEKDVSLGRKLGPFLCPPCADFIASPLGAFQKRSSGKVRVVHDLSYPRGRSVNDFVSREECSVQYLSMDSVVSAVKKFGRNALLAKADLSDAYHHVLVHPDDWSLLGSVYICEDGTVLYYVSTVLPFGLSPAPAKFTDIAIASKLIMLYGGASYIDQYLDDFITMGPAGSSECQSNLGIMLETFQRLGFSVNPQKVSKEPTTVLEFLGIVIDTNLLQLRISKDRLDAVMEELLQWKSRTSAKKRNILSLIGKLTFVSRVVRSGRTFVRRLIDTAKKAKHLHHSVRLSKAFQADIDWWLEYLPQWNGVSVFFDDLWISNTDMDLFTDASDLAVAGYFKGDWFVLPASKAQSINWRELYAVVVAAATFGQHWTGKRIVFHCDNMCVVHVLCSGTSKNVALMNLVRRLFYIAAMYQFECRAQYINTHANSTADSLSRYQWDIFHRVAPNASPVMTSPVLLGEGLDM